MSNRLTNTGFSFIDVMKSSKKYYSKVDDKKYRAKVDIASAKLIKRNNYEYSPSDKTWSQTGRDAYFLFMVRSQPVSYKRIDTINNHWYPVHILMHNVELGLNSPFRWRTGSLKKPIFAKKGMSKRQRVQVANKNIKNMTQLDFFFKLEFLLKQNNLLYGVCRANRPANKANPDQIIYFDKTMLYVVEKILSPLFQNEKFKLKLNKAVMNK